MGKVESDGGLSRPSMHLVDEKLMSVGVCPEVVVPGSGGDRNVDGC